MSRAGAAAWPRRGAQRASPGDQAATANGAAAAVRIAVAALYLLTWCAAQAAPDLDAAKGVGAPAAAAATARGAARDIDPAWLAQVYPRTQPDPVWFTQQGPRPAVAAALGALGAASERGLSPDDYGVDALARSIAATRERGPDSDAVTRADRALTAAVLQFLSDLRFGRVRPQEVEPHLRVPARAATFAADLRDAVARDRIAELIVVAEPAFPQYAQLKRLLAEYRDLATRPPPLLPAFASPHGKVVAGDRYAGVPALRSSLVAFGDLPAGPAAPDDVVYTNALAAAVQRFQARHGLEPDGVLGKDTLAALNTPIETRVSQIVLSLERLRWLPDFAPGPVIAVNIPSFRLWAFTGAGDSARAALSMPVVVGRAVRTETPVFIGEMRYVEFSPYWNVPPSILRNELLPRIARDPAYLAREDMEIVNVRPRGAPYADAAAALAALRAGDARLRQRPGPKNAVGGVKFVLPNTLDVYLHATPARELFSRTRRDFSHGCIRVGDPEALASFVLRDQPEWTAAEIEAAMKSRVNRWVPVTTPVPVVVFYTTAIVDGEGRALFLPDIYGHDRRLRAALAAARSPAR